MKPNVSVLLTAGGQLVGTVLAVGHAVAESALVNALRGSLRSTLGAVELVVRAGDGRAVVLVGAVGAVLVAVAAPPGGDATVVLAPELSAVARREIWNTKDSGSAHFYRVLLLRGKVYQG